MASYDRPPRRIGSPFTSPRRFPPASPSQSLFGLEKAVPPKPSFDQLSYRSWDSTPAGSSTDVNKPLPQSPTRSRASSVYSGGSGYTRIIESYGSDEEIPPMPALLQPTARLDTVASLLHHGQREPWYADGLKTEDSNLRTCRDTVDSLLHHGQGVPWYANNLKIQDRNLRTSQSIPTLQYAPFRDERWNTSAHELSQAPAFSEYRNRMHDPVSPVSPGSFNHRSSNDFLSPPLVSPPLVHAEYHLSLDHERHYLPGPMSASVTEIVDPHLVPKPLRMSKTASMYFDVQRAQHAPSSSPIVKHVELLDIKEAQRRAAAAKQRDLESRAAELVARKGSMRESSLIDIAEAQRRQAYDRLQRTSAPYEMQRSSAPHEQIEPPRPRPHSVSSDSFVIYTGLRESVKVMIKQKLKQKKESREIEKAAKIQEKERKCVLSSGESRYLSTPSTTTTTTKLPTPRPSQEQQPPRKYSWTNSNSNRRSSLSDGMSNLFRKLSVSKTQREEESSRGRNMERGRRPKQLAVPPSPYQKYGAEVWYAKNKKARKNLQASSGVQRAPAMVRKGGGGRFVTRGDLGGQRPGLKKKRSEDLTRRYQEGVGRLRGVLGVDGAREEQERVKKPGRKLGLGKTMSEVRRERLKKSIAVLGLAQQPELAKVDEMWV